MIKLNKSKNDFFNELSFFLVRPSLLKDQKVEICQNFNFDECSKQFFINPTILKEYNLFSQNTESSLEQ